MTGFGARHDDRCKAAAASTDFREEARDFDAREMHGSLSPARAFEAASAAGQIARTRHQPELPLIVAPASIVQCLPNVSRR